MKKDDAVAEWIGCFGMLLTGLSFWFLVLALLHGFPVNGTALGVVALLVGYRIVSWADYKTRGRHRTLRQVWFTDEAGKKVDEDDDAGA